MQTTTPTTAPALEVQGLSIGYEDHTIFEGLDLAIEAGSVTTLIGANGCGKSTLLRGLSRLLKPSRGEVLLQGTPLRTRSTKAIAAELAFLPQKPVTPVSTSVRELVSRGRYPHRKAWELHGGEHHRIVDAALQATNLSDLADVDAASLSGGQLQRAWIALVLAQETPVVLLDEPTTYLDLAHQLEVLRLVRDMNRERNATVVMVLHDLNLAARSSDRLIAVANGAVVADGAPWDVITPAVLDTVFGLDASVIPDPVTGTPMVVPAADL